MKNKKALYIAIPALVLVAIIALVVTLFAPGGLRGGQSNDSQEPVLGEYIPVDSDTALITPSNSEWWDTVSSFAPAGFELKGQAPGDDLKVSYLGYSRSPNHQEEALAGTGPLQLFYLQSPTHEDAEAVASWMKADDKLANKGMDVKTLDNVNVVSFKWATLRLEQTDKPLSGDPLFTDEVPLIWMNYDKMNEVLTTPATTGKGNDVVKVDPREITKGETPDMASMLRSAVGITNGTVWKATSKDNGATWGGKFVAGGIDKSQINPDKAQEIVSDSSKVVMEVTRPGQSSSTTRLLTHGLGPLQQTFGLKYDGTDKTFGPGPTDLNGLDSVPGQIVSGSAGIGTQHIDMTMPDSASSPSGIGQSQISASETEMNIKFTPVGS